MQSFVCSVLLEVFHLSFQPLCKAKCLPCRHVLWDSAVESWGRGPDAGLGLQNSLCDCSFHMWLGMPRTRLPNALCLGGWMMAPGSESRGRQHVQFLQRGWWLPKDWSLQKLHRLLYQKHEQQEGGWLLWQPKKERAGWMAAGQSSSLVGLRRKILHWHDTVLFHKDW